MSAAATPTTELDEGRYLYCVVGVDGSAAFDVEVEGIESEPVHVVTDGGLGAVVHSCDSLYDTDDTTTLTRWLVAHQRVTDAAADAFGTPLPVRFDTVLTGDDDTVRGWLRESAEGLREALDAFAGMREYRIEVRHDEGKLADQLAETDDRLREFRARRDDADTGTGFLVDKQYERRLAELVRNHRETEAESVAGDLSRHAERVRRLGANRSASLVDATSSADGSSIRFAVLAPVANEDDIGSTLDDVAAEDGVEVRFSGPWPPYTFAPTLGGDPVEEEEAP
jgi:hypothetical protein